jgi:hypothetical protein
MPQFGICLFNFFICSWIKRFGLFMTMYVKYIIWYVIFWAKPYSKTLGGPKKACFFGMFWNILTLNPLNKLKK